MNIVPRRNTPITAAKTAAAVRTAYVNVFSENPPRRVLELLLALVWTETGAGKSCQNFNVGNITAGSAFSGDAWRPTWFELGPNPSERDVRLHEAMLRGQAPSAFRAYGSLELGCADFIRILRRSFPEVLEAAESGDADEFREALSLKYSPDYRNPKVTQTFEKFQIEFRAVLGNVDLPGERAFPVVAMIGAFAIAAAAGGLLYLTLRKEPEKLKEAAA